MVIFLRLICAILTIYIICTACYIFYFSIANLEHHLIFYINKIKILLPMYLTIMAVHFNLFFRSIVWFIYLLKGFIDRFIYCREVV